MADDCTYVLVTGANTGIGFAICCRLLDEFLENRPSSQSIHLTITTRSPQKSAATISALNTHITRDPRLKALSQNRISLHTAELDLTLLPSVLDASQRLRSTHPKLDVVILNAGIAGAWTINWPKAIVSSILDPVEQVTYPTFARGTIGALAKPQRPAHDAKTPSEPPLGEVFCANVFGHYLLVHALAPLLAPAAHPRIIFISSLEAAAHVFAIADLQALTTEHAYHSSKRLSDILALTAALPPSKPYVDGFSTAPPLSTPPRPPPRFYVAHPGVCNTSIWPLMWLVLYFKMLAFYVARWLGSPWHPITPYKGAVAPVWLALVAQATLDRIEERDGQGKWGSSTDMWGRERVMRTEVDGWGFGGTVGGENRFGKRARRRNARDLTVEEREKFEELGRDAWKEMERLRIEWEMRLK